MANDLIRFNPAISRDLSLDKFVRTEHPFEGVAIDFLGDNLESAAYARTRISPIYRNTNDMFGYLELSRTTARPDETKKLRDSPFRTSKDGKYVFEMLGVIEVPGSILTDLEAINPKVLRAFVHDFKIQDTSPENIQIAPFHGFDLPEETYFWCAHPNAHCLPKDNSTLREKYKTDLFILTGYLSKMNQWINHAYKGKIGKQRIEYSGLATRVGAKRYPGLPSPQETPLITE